MGAFWVNSRAQDLSLGGDQCGHVIFTEYASTGDGLLTDHEVLRPSGTDSWSA